MPQKSKKNLLFIIIFWGLMFFLSFRYPLFNKGAFGHNWDWSFPSIQVLYKNIDWLSKYLWDRFNLGNANNLTLAHLAPVMIFNLLGRYFGPSRVLLIIFGIITIVGFFGFKKLLDYLILVSNLNFIPAFLFAFSPFLFNDIIGGAWPMWVSFAFSPLYFLFFVKYLKTSQYKFFFFLLISSNFIIISIQNFVLINVLLVFFIIYEILTKKEITLKSTIIKLVIFFICFLLINLYWLLPFIYSSGDFMRNVVFKNAGINEFVPIKNSRQTIWNIFNLGGYLDRNMYLYTLPRLLKLLFNFAVFSTIASLFYCLVFVKNNPYKQKLNFWSLVLLILVLIIKGGNKPFSGLTLWFYENIAYMKLFRSPQHLMFIPAFIVPILFALLIYSYLFYFRRRKKIIVFGSIFIVTLWISGWWYNGDLGSLTLLNQKRDHIDFYRLPPELTKYYEQSEKDRNDYRTFFLPASFSPLFLKTEYQNEAQGIQPEYRYLDKPTFVSEFNKFADNIEMSFCRGNNLNYVRYLSLFSVKNIILRSDIYPHFTESSKCWNNNEVRAVIESLPSVGKFLEGKYVTAYGIKNDYFLPHFYIPQNIIYSNDDVESLVDITGMGDYEIRSAIYLENSKKEGQEILGRANEIFVETKLENGIDKGYFDKLESYKNGIELPHVEQRPNSFGWQLARLKEKYEEWSVRKEPEKLIDKNLFFASKRISEIEKFSPQSEAEIGKLENLWEQKMREAIEEVEKYKNLNPQKGEEQVIKLRAYWEKQKEEIEKLRNLSASEQAEIGRFESWKRAFEELDKEIGKMEEKFDLENLEYSFEIPKEGNYTLLLQIPNSKLQIEIDGKEIEIEKLGNSSTDGWAEIGERNFAEGSHKLVLHLPAEENLVGDDWQKSENLEIFPKEAENLVFQPIKNWEKDTLYDLSFEYQTKGGSLGLGMVEERNSVDEEKGEETLKEEKILDKKLRSWETEDLGDWNKFETLVSSNEEAQGAEIYFYTLSDPNKEAKVNFRNVKIVKVEQPKIILSSASGQAEVKKLPKITFVKVNPTKYRIKVEGATEPYTLVFSESFHQGWKIYVNKVQSSKFKVQNDYGEEVASYFDGEIKEGTHRMTFLEPATFETWGKKPIAEDKHLLVNGYANSWYVTPEDTGGEENYELIVEFWPQRLFYIGLFISGLTLIGCLGYLAFNFFRKK